MIERNLVDVCALLASIENVDETSALIARLEARHETRCEEVTSTSVTPPIQSYTNHTRKRVRSRSGTHGKISQHNSKNKKSHTSIIIQARGLEGSNTSARS